MPLYSFKRLPVLLIYFLTYLLNKCLQITPGYHLSILVLKNTGAFAAFGTVMHPKNVTLDIRESGKENFRRAPFLYYRLASSFSTLPAHITGIRHPYYTAYLFDTKPCLFA
jgi:hypothetical protein